jgi:hypothetical protein
MPKEGAAGMRFQIVDQPGAALYRVLVPALRTGDLHRFGATKAIRAHPQRLAMNPTMTTTAA